MTRIRKTICSVLAAALTLSLTTGVASAAYGSGSVNAGPLRLRAEPNTSSAVLASARRGAEVEVLEPAQDGWYKVSYAGKVGYMSAEFLDVVAAPAAEPVQDVPAVQADAADVDPDADAPDEEPDAPDAGASETLCALVTASPSLNVRSGPGTGYAKVGSLRCGSVVTVLEQGAEWSRIQNGYISNEFVVFLSQTDAEGSELGLQAVETARQYLGCRYVYGGTSPSGFDCSGLIYYVYKALGVSVPRTGSSMWNSLPHVEGDLSAGDVVCFTRTSNSSHYITHVGMYIGNGQFIHACSPRYGVIVSSLSESYYATRYAGAVRAA